MSWKNTAAVILLLLLALLAASYVELPANLGALDFRAYWSASRLLTQSRDFSDSDLLLRLQRDLTGSNNPFVMKTWNPPWVLTWLIPYALLPFRQAVFLWLLTNIGLLFAAVVIGWRLIGQGAAAARPYGYPLLMAVAFPSTLVALLYGQVNILVMAGLIFFLWFESRRQDAAAGVALALVTCKPHLVYLTLPIILLHLLRERRWRTLAAAAAALMLSTAVVFVLRPTFLGEFFGSSAGGDLFQWETATLSTFLSLKLGWPAVRLIGVLLLPLSAAVWFRYQDRLPLIRWVEISLLLSLITMPFGWSYDFVLLLPPMLRVLSWILSKDGPIADRTAAALALAAMIALYMRQRVQTPSEMYFFWVPLVVAALYGWLWLRCRQPASSEKG